MHFDLSAKRTKAVPSLPYTQPFGRDPCLQEFE